MELCLFTFGNNFLTLKNVNNGMILADDNQIYNMPDIVNDASNPDKSSSKPLRDEVTKNKIDKHLKDIDDTISEEDIKNINTEIISSKGETTTIDEEEIDDVSEVDNKDDKKDGGNKDNDEPQKEAPSPWEILS